MRPRRYTGSCHCGAIRVEFSTSRPLSPRACQCAFCRRHGARSVSDPAGEAALRFEARPTLYRFATFTADYILCSVCGAYMGAMAADGTERRITLNLNQFADPHPELAAAPVSYEGEDPAERMASRFRRWTPLRSVPVLS